MNLKVTPTTIYVETPFELKANIKALRGGRWSPSLKQWCFPATPHAAQRLVEAFPWIKDHPKLQPLLETPPAGYQAADHLPHWNTTLWDHQRRAVQACFFRPASMLAMEMRTGKTAVALALASLWGCRTILVTCPVSVVGVWAAEIDFHSGQDWLVTRLATGSVKKNRELLDNAMVWSALHNRSVIAIVNHESLWREPFGSAVLGIEWDLVIVDESHRSKAPAGKFSRYLARLADKVPKRLALTGTPLPHSMLDAYGQWRFLDRTIFGSSFNRFKTHFATWGGFDRREVIRWENTEEFSNLFHKIAFECSTDEAFDLPDEMDIMRSTILEPSAQKTYDSMEKHFWAGVESGEITASNALVKLLRLQQICAGWVKDDQDTLVQVSTAKVDLLTDILEDFTPDTPLVIFVRFTKDIQVIREACEKQGRRVGEVSGQHKDITDSGTFPEDLDVLVCQIQSGSLGINLSRASTCIFYSWGWSLGDVEQARARIRHPNQISKLQFIHLIIEKSIDERMLGCLKTRKDFIEDVLEQGRA